MLPENLTPELISNLNLNEKFTPNILLFLGLLRSITEFKRAVIREEDPYAHIGSKFLTHFILTLGNDIKRFFNILEKEGWIEINHSYTVGVKSKGYRIGPKFKKEKWIKKEWKSSLEFFVPRILIKSNIARKKEVLYDLWDRASVYFSTWETMPDGPLKTICSKTQSLGDKVRITLPDNINEIVRKCAEEHVEKEKKSRKKKRKKDEQNYEWTVQDQIENYNYALSRFDGKSFYVSIHDGLRFPKGSGRLFSNIVNLKKEFRSFLHINGEHFVNVDIQSCQVALLATFYKPEDSAEKEKFIHYICSKDIYLFLSEGTGLARDDAKTAMYRVMFDKELHQQGKVYENFVREFPILSSRISDNKRKHGYENVSFEMQKKESSIMIGGVLHSLLIDEDILCFSIHDSIFCFRRDAEYIQKKIYSFFFAEMGFCPTVHIKD